MNKDFFEIIEKLKKENKTISIMESCSGGIFLDEITNIEGSSKVFNYGCVVYDNNYKIKMGIDKKIIVENDGYGEEIAKQMSKRISIFSNSDYGIGIDGYIGVKNKDNINTEISKYAYISIYSANDSTYCTKVIKINSIDREIVKRKIFEFVINDFKNILGLK